MRLNLTADNAWWPWLVVAIGAVIMYAPSFYDLFTGIWSTDQQGHGPIVLAISVWLLYRKWPDMMAAGETETPSMAGWPVLCIGLLLFVLGRSQGVLLFEIGSVLWVLVAVILLMRGPRALKTVWFPLFFMLFMIPLPGVFVDAVTMPMKTAVSIVAEHVLYWAGYPIARTGVTLQIGPYQLLVADACAGLHTLFTLEALGLLYLNLVRHESVARNIMLAILIVPISFTANVIRVMVLTLITYYWGDEAGQGFLHGFAGMVLFLSALLLIIGVDGVARMIFSDRNTHVEQRP
ncbi:MAG: exosortase B [Porticoccaceae bacterium]|nr:exosortase B [Porticoccaceae bacterium]